MGRDGSRPAPRERAGLVGVHASPACNTANNAPLSSFQADFIAARFGLDGVRARVVAELAWGRA